MNKIVNLWDKHQRKVKYDGPDAITIEGQKIRLEELEEMAVRKKPHTEPVWDNDAVNKDKRVERSLIVHELSKPDFNSLIFYLLKSHLDRVNVIRTATWGVLKRLGLKRDTSKAIRRLPKGVSTQGDAGSVLRWLNKIQPNHKKSIAQLVVIDATAVNRTGK